MITVAKSKSCQEMAAFRLGVADHLRRVGISRNQLAKRIGWTSGQISVWLSTDSREQAEADAQVGTCVAIAEALQVPMTSLFTCGNSLLPEAQLRWDSGNRKIGA